MSHSNEVERALQILDTAEVTEDVFHDAVHGLPLTAALLEQVAAVAAPGERVLVIGANPLLALALCERYVCDLYTLAEESPPAAVRSAVRGRLQPADLVSGAYPAADGGYAAIVLPFLLDTCADDALPLLRGARERLRPGGRLILAGTNQVKLGSRLRALRGRDFLPMLGNQAVRRPGGWPALPERRHYTVSEIGALAESVRMQLAQTTLTSGYAAYNEWMPLSPVGWLAALVRHRLTDALPAWRPYWVASLSDLPQSGVPAPEETNAANEPMPEARPFVSVILPTHNRAEMLRECLENGVFLQSYPPESWELILIDDGSHDETPQMLDELLPRCPATVRRYRLEGVGAAAARNFGMREARGSIVAHLDDDGYPVPNWLESGVRAFTPGVALVAGPILTAPNQPLGFFIFQSHMPRDRGLYPTSNVFYARDVALAEGLFDESFGKNFLGRPMPGWDSDLAWRMRRRGYRVAFAPQAVMFSFVFSLGFRGWLNESRKAELLPLVVQRVPETRAGIFPVLGLINDQLHLTWLVSVLGLLLALIVRRREPLALATPYLAYFGWLMRDDAFRPQRWPKLAGKYGLMWLFQALCFYHLMRGAIRARIIVL